MSITALPVLTPDDEGCLLAEALRTAHEARETAVAAYADARAAVLAFLSDRAATAILGPDGAPLVRVSLVAGRKGALDPQRIAAVSGLPVEVIDSCRLPDAPATVRVSLG